MLTGLGKVSKSTSRTIFILTSYKVPGFSRVAFEYADLECIEEIYEIGTGNMTDLSESQNCVNQSTATGPLSMCRGTTPAPSTLQQLVSATRPAFSIALVSPTVPKLTSNAPHILGMSSISPGPINQLPPTARVIFADEAHYDVVGGMMGHWGPVSQQRQQR